MLRGFFGRLFRPFKAALALGAVLSLFGAPLLSGCAGGAADGDTGEVVIGLTDADGDFLTYQVDVLSLTLTRNDGTIVEVLPLTTRVDFAQYTDMTEFLTAAMVPTGVYTGATMRLDYNGADVQVEVAGDPVPATLQDGKRDPLGEVTVAVRLDDRKQLNIRPGVPAHLVLDFELAASNDVDLTDPAAPVVTVAPFLLAEVDPKTHKMHRLRGLLAGVNVEANLFHLRVRPFSHRGHHDHFGHFPVKTDADTAFEIDGQAYTGRAGLEVLDTLPDGTPVVAVGKVNRAGRHMQASRVRAGSSVPWGDMDAVKGAVIARDGDRLTLSGVAITFRDHPTDKRVRPDRFHPIVHVLLGPDTKVVRAGDDTVLDKDDVSVGQRITALGKLLLPEPQVDALALTAPRKPHSILPPPVTLDATEGKVRLRLSTVVGTVVQADPGVLVMDATRFNGRPADHYDFTGTGDSPANDADPADYGVDTGILETGALEPGAGVLVTGHVTRFGTAPLDFVARSLAYRPVVPVPALLQVKWRPATAAPFLLSGPDGVTLDLAESPKVHHVLERWKRTDLTTLAMDTRVLPPVDGSGRFAIGIGDGILSYGDFADFEAALGSVLSGGGTVAKMTGHGTWDAAGATFVVHTLSVGFKVPEGAVGIPGMLEVPTP